MRFLLGTSLLAVNILCALAQDQLHARKSVAFSPILPHAIFHSTPSQIHFNNYTLQSPDSDPLDIGRQFIEDLLREQISQKSSLIVRNDSYTDTATGITHVYVQQVIHGLEVTNSKLNVNIKDGMVLSYGDSFYRGPVPASVGPKHCATLTHRLQGSILALNSNRKMVLEHGVSPCDGNFPPLRGDQEMSSSSDSSDPRKALLQFMLAVTPDRNIADDILMRSSAHVANMTSTFSYGSVGSHKSIVEIIENVPDAVNPVKATLAFTQIPHDDGVSLILVWKFEVRMRYNWYTATVSVTPPYNIISVVDWVSDASAPVTANWKPTRRVASYNVFAWGINDPSKGSCSMVKERIDLLASPFGWHSLPESLDPRRMSKSVQEQKILESTTTFGNNVFAQEFWDSSTNWVDNYRPDAGESLIFDYAYNPMKTKQAEQVEAAKIYINATLTQLFYTVNMVHDLYYRYGFDEVSGNFQQYNFERGGVEGDAVIALAQDAETMNGALFISPPDGSPGTMSIYLWDTVNPYRDGDMDAGIVIHELTHGLSNRLTGGPSDADCLGSGESGGMGEGWGDFMATTIRSTDIYSDYPIGAWARNREQGIRKYPYSIKLAINPSTYKFLDKDGYGEVHLIGEVWAEMLWIVSQNLIAKHGFSNSLFPPAPLEDGTIPEGDFYRPAEYASFGKRKPLIPKHGNSLMVQLVLNGMKLQPCSPSFFYARDAIIQADEILTGGENYCDLWEGFAQRGLGPSARLDKTSLGRENRTEDFELPPRCQIDLGEY